MSLVYDDFCRAKECDHYIEWEFSNSSDEQPYPCTSCNLTGQSYYVDRYPEDCPFINEIKEYEVAENESL